MNRTTDLLLQAIEELRPELPDLLGDAWPDFETRLAGYLQRLAAEPDRAPIIQALILALFGEYPRAHERLVEILERLGYQHPATKGTTLRGASPPAPPLRPVGRPPAAAEPAPTVTRYTDIACPRRVWIATPRVVVTLGLTLQPSPLSAAVEEVRLRAELPVRVRISAPGFTLLSEPEQETAILPDRDSPPVVFYLRPQRTGPTRVSFDLSQGGNPMGAVSVPVEITAHPVPEIVEPRPAYFLRAEPDAEPPDLKLFIEYDRFAARPALTFTLEQSGAPTRRFEPVLLEGDAEAHARQIYAALTEYTENRRLPSDDVDRRVRQLGRRLWRELIPGELKELYAAQRQAWRGRSMVIISDEPHFPWELVWPYDRDAPWADEQPWCITLRLTRWLRRDARGNGRDFAPARLRLNALACLAPTDAGLRHAARERRTLAELAQSHGFADVSPDPPTLPAVLALLEGGDYDWVHAATHGRFDGDRPGGALRLRLQKRAVLTPSDLLGPEIEGPIRRREPAFVFNACEVGQQAWGLTRLDGWADVLLGAGASLFIAPLWTVTDELAVVFAETFYGALLQGVTVAEAVRQARLAAHRAGDPTWLAYSVYGHPNARVALVSSSIRG